MSRFLMQSACAILLAAVSHFGVAAQSFYTPPAYPFYAPPAYPFYAPPAYPFYAPPNRPFYTPPNYRFYEPPGSAFKPVYGPRAGISAYPMYAHSGAAPTPPKEEFVAPAPAVMIDYAEIRVLVPDPQARISFDGSSTAQTGKDRLFYTPTLKMGSTPSYQIRVTWMQGTQEMSQNRVVRVAPGQTTVVDFKQ